jgi:hypothetical protein
MLEVEAVSSFRKTQCRLSTGLCCKCHSLIPAQEEVIANKGGPQHLRTGQLSIQKLVFVVLQQIVMHVRPLF